MFMPGHMGLGYLEDRASFTFAGTDLGEENLDGMRAKTKS